MLWYGSVQFKRNFIGRSGRGCCSTVHRGTGNTAYYENFPYRRSSKCFGRDYTNQIGTWWTNFFPRYSYLEFEWGRNCRKSGRKRDRKSTRLNSSHANISYAVFCLKKKKKGR